MNPKYYTFMLVLPKNTCFELYNHVVSILSFDHIFALTVSLADTVHNVDPKSDIAHPTLGSHESSDGK